MSHYLGAARDYADAWKLAGWVLRTGRANRVRIYRHVRWSELEFSYSWAVEATG